MKVTYEKSFLNQLVKTVDVMPEQVILRSDLAFLGSPRQLSRGLKVLVVKGNLAKLGYGVYAKLTRSELTGASYLAGGFLSAGRAALTKLNIAWQPSQEEQAYNAGESTQVPINPSTKIQQRFRRKLYYKTMELKVV